jgi:TRAP-type C4-dicarboxylate transport system permease small subunit
MWNIVKPTISETLDVRFLHDFLEGCRTYSAMFWAVTAVMSVMCYACLKDILRHIQCLHEDFETAHNAHKQQALEDQIVMDKSIDAQIKAKQNQAT